MQTDQTYKAIRKSVETVQPGAKIAVQLRNDSKRESLQGEYVAMGDDMLLMVATMFTMNEGQKKKIVSVPFGSIKYIEFPEIEVPSE